MMVVVVSESDPVALRVADRWGTPPATGDHLDGAAIRRLAPEVLLVRRAVRHIHDERLDRRLPPGIRERRPTLVFPSIHRSEQNVACLTVHPLGNPGLRAEFGGRPHTWVPTDARRMAAALRALAERAGSTGLAPTFEATHHGPELDLPAFFVEIGFGAAPGPSDASITALAETVPEIAPDPSDRVAVGIGGGHYAPHFTELVIRRHWAFAHIVSRHALTALTGDGARAALASSEGAEGFLFARAQDADHAALRGWARRLRETEAPARPPSSAERDPISRDARPSGT